MLEENKTSSNARQKTRPKPASAPNLAKPKSASNVKTTKAASAPNLIKQKNTQIKTNIPYEALSILTNPKNKILSIEESLRLFTNKKDVNAYVVDMKKNAPELLLLEKFAKLRGFPKKDVLPLLEHIKTYGIETANGETIHDVQQVVDECCYWPTATVHFYNVDFQQLPTNLGHVTKHFRGNKAVKRGDVLVNTNNRYDGTLVWDGKKAVPMNYSVAHKWGKTHLPNELPKEFAAIREFPVHFWCNASSYMDDRMLIWLSKKSSDIVRSTIRPLLKHLQTTNSNSNSEDPFDNMFCVINEEGRKYGIDIAFNGPLSWSKEGAEGDFNDMAEVLKSKGPMYFISSLRSGSEPNLQNDRREPYDIVHKSFLATRRNSSFKYKWERSKKLNIPYENMGEIRFYSEIDLSPY